MGAPLGDWLVEVKVGALTDSELKVGMDGGFGQQVTGGGLVDGDIVRTGMKGGEAAAQFGGVQQLMWKLMPGCAEQGAFDDAASGVTEHEASGCVEKGFAGVVLQLMPKMVGALYERDVIWMFVIGLANDARMAVGGAVVVSGTKTFEPKNAFAAGGKMIGGGAAHASES
jgi:hypothetical protein